jgi:tRNA pseudouridine65 synthase
MMDSLNPEHILYRDSQLLVLNKPAGVPVHGSRMHEGRPATLLGMARELTGQMVHAVHRLDRPVSGAILLAFDKSSLATLSSDFENRRVGKSYLGVVRGWTPEAGTIDHPLLPPRDERRAGTEARPAVTRFERLGKVELPVPVPPYRTARYSLLVLTPETGRRHQLRRHMKHASHHFIGDTTYGKGEHNTLFRERFDCHRLLLHSRALVFRHPLSGEKKCLTAPLDDDFSRVEKIFSGKKNPGPPESGPGTG